MAARISRSDARRYSSFSTALGVAALAAGLSGLAYSAGKGGDRPPAPQRVFVPEFNVVEVPVPERPVPAGTLLREVPFRLEKYPAHQLPQNVVREVGRSGELTALVSLPAGLPIAGDNLGSADEATNPILGHIPPGMRAMTVSVDATAAVEGWARSGSIVDVLLVEKAKTAVVAEKVKVISAERSLSPVEASGAATVPSTVTLLVTQEQCLAISTAVPLGRITFALRSSRDSGSWRDTHFAPEDLAPAEAPSPRAKVEGVVAFGGTGSRQRFALVQGAWLPADDVPSGFLLENRGR